MVSSKRLWLKLGSFTSGIFLITLSACAPTRAVPDGANGFAQVTGDTRPASIPSAGEQAHSADGFVNSMGVNTHINWSGVWASTYVLSSIESLGIRHLRDIIDLNPSIATWEFNKFNLIADSVKADTGVRIGYDFLLDYPGQWNCVFNQAPIANILGYANINNLDSFEGLNEYNLFNTIGNCGGDWSAEDHEYQKILYQTEKTTVQLAGLPVIGPSLAWANSSDAVALGQLGSSVDYANQHSYPGGNYPPSHNIKAFEDELNSANVYGNKPYIATETGYSTDTADAGGVSESQAGQYISHLYFEYYNAGVVRTYIYDLIDDPSQSGLEAHYGLVRSNGSLKPEAIAIKNEIELLSDPGSSSFVPGKLNYTLNAPSQVHHTLLEKANGDFYLALWQEVTAGAATVNATITFGSAASRVDQYQPLTSATAFASQENVSQVSVSVPDSILILRIQL